MNTLTINGASSTPSSEIAPATPSSNANAAPATRPASCGAALAEQRRVRGNERRGERAFAEQVLQHVRQPQAGAEHVGVQARAEVRREHALADQADDAAQKMPRPTRNAAAPERGAGARLVDAGLAVGRRHQRIVTSSSALVG